MNKVSVIIPTYKRSEYLSRAIESILNQTYEILEIIVIDDNHPDSQDRLETKKRMKKYNENDKVIYHQNKFNLGGALARNEGIKIATGEFVTFLDDDDYYEVNKIESQIKYMLINNLDLSFTNIKIFNENNKMVDYRDHKYVKSLHNKDLLKYHLLHHLTPTNTYMFKTSSLKKIGGFDDAIMGQEFHLMLKSINSGLKIGYLPTDYVVQILHSKERISVGPNKINAEIELYKLKKGYNEIFNSKEKRYLKFRHRAVLAIVHKRSRNYLEFIKYSLSAFLTSPWFFTKELLNRVKKPNLISANVNNEEV
ncbi:glycosyltransferase family 2 protein [Exiguobacterium aurantiacum]|uniref:glycosyltransferase family 2 protein n=1 Tax=Exiguobacterium aurantiacum TaxID=33987 RepID=UPI001E385F0F|nr:glycosyltransferase family 2 protein [Exiguobacterium aurantiacum]